MSLLGTTMATAWFEIRRSLSLQRIMVATVLAAFPPAMIAVIGFSGQEIRLDDFLIIILVAIVALLAQLLWATSNVYTELEGKSWIFLASRPRGRVSLFLGKYLSAVFFSFVVCLVAITLCLAIRTAVTMTFFTSAKWLAMTGSALVGCMTYSAIFSVIGTVFQKKAMVFGAAYIILSEIILANVPAIISQFTARFHLQIISAEWIGWFFPIGEEDFAALYGEQSFLFHLICIVLVIPILLVIGSVVVTTRQYITSEET